MAIYSIIKAEGLPAAASDLDIARASSNDSGVGRALGYDPIRDEYTVVGKLNTTGKAQDLTIEGVAVAALIHQVRSWGGDGHFKRHGLTRTLV